MANRQQQPMFGTSTKKFSIGNIVGKPQSNITTANDINNAIGNVADIGTAFVAQKEKQEEKEALELYQKHSLAYNQAKEEYRKENLNAVTSEEKKKVFMKYANTLETLSNSPALLDKYKIQMQKAKEVDLYYASASYEAVLDKEEDNKFKGAVADVITAHKSLPEKEQLIMYNQFLDASNLYRKDRGEAAAIMADSLVKSTEIQLNNPNISWKEAKGGVEKVLNILETDKFSQNKKYLAKAKMSLNTSLSNINKYLKEDLKAKLVSENYTFDNKIDFVDKATNEGWLSQYSGKALITGIKSDKKEAETKAYRTLTDAKLEDLTISEDEAHKAAYDKKNGYDKNTSKAKFMQWKAKRNNLARDINLTNIENIADSEKVPVNNRIEIIKQAIKNEENELQKSKLEGILAGLENEKIKKEIKRLETTWKDKASTYSEAMFAINEAEKNKLYTHEEAKKAKRIVEARQTKRVEALERKNLERDKQIEKGYTKDFRANMANKKRSKKDKLADVENNLYLTKAEASMWRAAIETEDEAKIQDLIKDNLKRDKELNKKREGILKSILKNEKYPTPYKIKKIQDYKGWGTEKKKAEISILKKQDYKEQEKYRQRLMKEEAVAYQNIAENYKIAIDNGDYTIPVNKYRNAIASGWYGTKKIPIGIKRSFMLYKKQKVLYDKISKGENIKDDPYFENVTIEKVPHIEKRINKLFDMSEITPQSLQEILDYMLYLDKNNYVIDKKTKETARIARVITRNNPTVGTEKFKTYLVDPKENGNKEEIVTFILRHTNTKSSFISRSNIEEVADAISRTSMNTKEAAEYIIDYIDDNFMNISPFLETDYLIPKGEKYMKTEESYENTIERLNKSSYTKGKGELKYIVPLDWTKMESTNWMGVFENETEKSILIKNDDIRIIREQ